MPNLSRSVLALPQRARPRTALVASSDQDFRQRLSEILIGLRWQVREACGGAEAWTETDTALPEAVIVDSWLPDLDHGEFLTSYRGSFPEVDLLVANGTSDQDGPRCAHRQELLYALRRYQDTDTRISSTRPGKESEHCREIPSSEIFNSPISSHLPELLKPKNMVRAHDDEATGQAFLPASGLIVGRSDGEGCRNQSVRLPELVGDAPCMLEVSRRVRLVAGRSTSVLIEGPTGSGKELVAAALHRLSTRSDQPFVAINCAAIPEALLEAELFGHTRGAFTGAVQGRVGRIEAADGGTLFLDEIGEMPLSLQSKLLRFVESGELQRVGNNEVLKVDVRIITATHRRLAQMAQSGAFRADLYYRLAVFLICTPSLTEHLGDLPQLVEHFLERMGRRYPVKRIDSVAVAKLASHNWPGNVRELEHVLERAAILAGDSGVLRSQEIDFGLSVN